MSRLGKMEGNTSVEDLAEQHAKEYVPLQRMGTKDDIANTALYLASHSYITGNPSIYISISILINL